MRSSVIFIFSVLLLIVSCENPETKKAAQKAKEDSLLQVQQDSLLDMFRDELEAIAKRVNDVSVRNGLLTTDSKEGEVLSKESILKKVESLDGLLQSNQQQLNDLYKRMRQSNIKNEELEKLIGNMQSRISERESQVEKLMAMLADKDMVIEDIKLSLDSMRMNTISLTEEIIGLDEEMHTVYYIVGEQKELKEQGVVTKEGGVLGLGASKKLNVSKLDTALFTTADQRELLSIPLYSQKARLITNHPEKSYEFVLDGEGTVESLSIIDRKSFWAATDYLVVEVSN